MSIPCCTAAPRSSSWCATSMPPDRSWNGCSRRTHRAGLRSRPGDPAAGRLRHRPRGLWSRHVSAEPSTRGRSRRCPLRLSRPDRPVRHQPQLLRRRRLPRARGVRRTRRGDAHGRPEHDRRESRRLRPGQHATRRPRPTVPVHGNATVAGVRLRVHGAELRALRRADHASSLLRRRPPGKRSPGASACAASPSRSPTSPRRTGTWSTSSPGFAQRSVRGPAGADGSAFRITLGGIELEYCQPLRDDGALAST